MVAIEEVLCQYENNYINVLQMIDKEYDGETRKYLNRIWEHKLEVIKDLKKEFGLV